MSTVAEGSFLFVELPIMSVVTDLKAAPHVILAERTIFANIQEKYY